MTTVVVSGAVANKPYNGGNAWAVLSWARGLARLGCDVYFVEELSDTSDKAVARKLEYFELEMARFGMQDQSALVDAGDRIAAGCSWRRLLEIAESADLLVNISGHLTKPELLKRLARKAYVDFDPGYTQFWEASGIEGARLEGHDHYFTVGGNVGRPDCCIPVGDHLWHPIRQPVVQDDWGVTAVPDEAAYTTVASWRGAFGPVEYGGRSYGQKVHEFRKIAELPLVCPQQHFEIALDIHPAEKRDIALLENSGWRLHEPKKVTQDSHAFRSFVQTSRAEVSAAQSIYVETHCGWFSDRTVRYLASGRPAVVQDTGFSRYLPEGEGLFAYRCMADIERAVNSIERDYTKHSKAARRVAETYFDSTNVLMHFLEEMDLTP